MPTLEKAVIPNYDMISSSELFKKRVLKRSVLIVSKTALKKAVRLKKHSAVLRIG